jgi:hypothetical protein
MNDIELENLISTVIMQTTGDLALAYKAPIFVGSGHYLELESKTCLGTISFWASGMMDWHIFDIATSAETLIGQSEVRDLDEIRNKITDIFLEIRGLDNKRGFFY